MIKIRHTRKQAKALVKGIRGVYHGMRKGYFTWDNHGLYMYMLFHDNV